MDMLELRSNSAEPVRVLRDITYGTALVGYNAGHGPMASRALLLDVHRPAGVSSERRPGIILAHGGAFHRGTKDDDAVTVDGHSNTPIAEYCARFAARGFVCFSIGYRMAPEDPHPGNDPILGAEDVPRTRIDQVREELGLGPSTAEMIRQTHEAGINDAAMAFDFVREKASHSSA